MTQNKSRIEPTFGENTQATENAQNTVSIKSPISISISSNVSPGHTFTPVLKRPVDAAQTLSTLEEKAMLKEDSVQPAAQPHIQTESAQHAGFTFPPVVEDSTQQVTENVMESELSNDPKEDSAETMKVEMPVNSMERVLPSQAQQAKSDLTAKVPAKFRRLALVMLLVLALLLVLFLLKPNTPETVESLQEQGTSLPIEFRPVDEAEAKRAEEEARALQMAQQAVADQAEVAKTVENSPVATEPMQVEQSNQVVTMPAHNTNNSPALALNEPKVVVEPVKKPEISGSVVYQPETVKTEPKKVERLKPSAPKTETAKAEKVASPKPKAEIPPPAKAPAVKAAEQSSLGIVSSKALTVPKGVSLMQVFRDNNLNISDVNAMSKANNAVSRLKVGEKVTVRLDKNGRVVEMSISSGKYIRQANGSYIFK